MQVSVVGLGVEGQKATISLLKRGYDVYASDINREIDLKLCDKTPLDKVDGKLDLEIGSHNLDKIMNSDAVAVSPSLFNKKICKDVINKGIFISDILTKHKNIKTIAVTGTNGKTTTSHMIYKILQDAGYKVIIGGNGGGGFSGYIDLILESNLDDYDYLVVEVCDMTLDFCKYVFNIDTVIVTNIGYDHMDIHGSIEHYTEEVGQFITNKKAILNWNDKNVMKIKDSAKEILLFNTYEYPLTLFGEFNRKNAEAARVTCKNIGIAEKNIKNSLENFESVEGRTKILKLNDKTIVTGKTDNVDALKAVLEEDDFDTVIIGTARKNEFCRYNILDYLKEYKPDRLIIFPGLDDITYEYQQYLNKLGYSNDLLVIKKIQDIIGYINKQTPKDSKIFLGGNGQNKITKISKMLQDFNKE